jgi:triosephosphate isomerase
LNGALATNQALIEGLARAWNPSVTSTWVVCPPFPYLPQVSGLLSGTGIQWGAQDVSNEKSGAFTGEVAASMLVEFGCRYALVGHSERRARWAESSDRVAQKTHAALESGLTPVICVGESLAERESGRTLEVLSAQLEPVLSSVPAHRLSELVLAYEPVWAIGTGRHATVEQVASVHGFIRSTLAAIDLAAAGEVSILYGGSVKPANASEYKALDNVDGVLVGGASLVATDFVEIARAFQG